MRKNSNPNNYNRYISKKPKTCVPTKVSAAQKEQMLLEQSLKRTREIFFDNIIELQNLA